MLGQVEITGIEGTIRYVQRSLAVQNRPMRCGMVSVCWHYGRITRGVLQTVRVNGKPISALKVHSFLSWQKGTERCDRNDCVMAFFDTRLSRADEFARVADFVLLDGSERILARTRWAQEKEHRRDGKATPRSSKVPSRPRTAKE